MLSLKRNSLLDLLPKSHQHHHHHAVKEELEPSSLDRPGSFSIAGRHLSG